MNYIKKLCILKQLSSGFAADGKTVSALLTAESFAGRVALSLSLIGFAPVTSGRYRFLVCDALGFTETFDIDSNSGATVKKPSRLQIEEGFCCLVCFSNGKVVPVAFGKCGDKTYDVKRLCQQLEQQEKPQSAADASDTPAKTLGGPVGAKPSSEINQPQKKAADTAAGKEQDLLKNFPDAPGGFAPPQAGEKTEYDDEIVATENYYEFDKQENSAQREEKQNGSESFAQKQKESGAEVSGKDEDAQSLFRIAGSENLGENARACYYEKVKEELSRLFDSQPAEEELAKAVPLSRWAKVTFARGKYYTVGVISDEKRPKYICYGVPTDKRGDPPDALKEYCSFVPLSIFDPDGKGYWMLFQDAETGACVKLAQK